MKRQAFEIPALKHGDQPIPVVARVGNIIASGTINGRDRETGKMPDELRVQVRNAFDNLAVVISTASGSLDDILKITVHMENRDAREALNETWIETFPDPQSRPARHVSVSKLPGAAKIQLELLACVEGGDR